MMQSKQPELPERLTKFKNDIPGCAMRQADQKFTANTWKDKLRGDSDLDYIIEKFPCGLDRSDLTSIAEEAAKNRDVEHYRKLFLASMIWRFGGDREAGFGAWRTQQMMDSEHFDGTLKNTSDLVLEGRIRDAYDLFKIKWCGPAFFTKYFYLGTGS